MEDLQTNDSLFDRFRETAARYPARTALEYQNRRYTYRELLLAANCAAAQLLRAGVQHGSVIGIELEKSDLYLIAILAILRAGCIYLPMKPGLPEKRISYMLNISGASHLITANPVSGRHGIQQLPVQQLLADCNPDDVPFPPSDRCAYIIFTSGTTGEPKGILIRQESVVNLIRSMAARIDAFRTHTELCICQTAEFLFDASVGQYYLALLTGTKLVLLPDSIKTDMDALSDFLQQRQIGIMDFTPTFLSMYLMYMQSVGRTAFLPETIISCGEALPSALAGTVYGNPTWKHVALYNFYGPTEACVYCTCCKVDRVAPVQTGRILIGTPLDQTEIFILDADMQPCAPGDTGEIYIAGTGLAEGYVNRVDLTDAAFLTGYPEYAPRLYKTGDFGRVTETGEIECLGRMDTQIKLRGFRIELKEIEASINKLDGILDNRVTVFKSGDSGTVVSYFISETEQSLSSMQEALREILPDYMIPSFFVPVKAFPLTVNGKLDTRALPDYRTCALTGSGISGAAADTAGTEGRVLQIMRESTSDLLLQPEDSLKTHGGDSLTLFWITVQINQAFSVRLCPADVMRADSAAAVCALLRQTGQTAPAEHASLPDAVPCSAFQTHLIQLEDHRSLVGSGTLKDLSYNMIYACTCTHPLDPERFMRTIHTLTEAYPVLRSTIRTEQLPYLLYTAETSDSAAEFAMVSSLTDTDIYAKLRVFEPGKLPLWQALLFQDAAGKQKIVFNFHHAIMDYYSVQLLTADFLAVYHGKTPACSADGFRAYLAARSSGLPAETHAFWKQYYAGRERAVRLTGDLSSRYKVLPGDRFQDMRRCIQGTPLAVLRQVLRTAGVSEYMLLLCAWARLLREYTGQRDVIIGTYVPGRVMGSQDYTDAIGCFMNLIGCRIRMQNSESAVEFVRREAAAFAETAPHQFISYMEAVRCLADDDLMKGDLLNTYFNYVSFDSFSYGNDRIRIREAGMEPAFHPLSVKAFSSADTVLIELKYDTRIYSEQFASGLTETYLKIIRRMAEECSQNYETPNESAGIQNCP